LVKNPIIKVYNLSLTEAINTRGAEVAKNATLSELNQLIQKGCLIPVDKLTVKKLKAEKQLILPSMLFLKDNYRPEGGFKKFKARLVARGDRQNNDDYESTSSPTGATSSVMMIAAISAKRGNARMTTDVPSVYPNAHMRDDMPIVYMKLDRAMTKLIVDNRRNWSRNVLHDGSGRIYEERGVEGGQNEAGQFGGGRIEPSRIEATRIAAHRVKGGRSQGGRSQGGRNRRSRSEPSRTEAI
jgi:hypothetical protein